MDWFGKSKGFWGKTVKPFTIKSKVYPPPRSQKEWNVIQNNPFGDADRDRVMNVFDCKPLNRKLKGWAHKGIQFNREKSTHVKMMSPDKFLRTTHLEAYGKKPKVSYDEFSSRVIEQKNVERLKKLIAIKSRPELKRRENRNMVDIPFLMYDKKGFPSGHEGRHRAMAAKQLGIKLMPVTIARELKEARDWKKIREGIYENEGKTYRIGKPAKKMKHDWKYDLENTEKATSSKSADIPIQEQREYGEEKPEALQKLEPESTYEKMVKAENNIRQASQKLIKELNPDYGKAIKEHKEKMKKEYRDRGAHDSEDFREEVSASPPEPVEESPEPVEEIEESAQDIIDTTEDNP